MEFQTFIAKVQRATQDYLGEGIQTEIHYVTKNNGVQMCGMSIRGHGEAAAPTIYLESLYEEYENGTPLGELVRRIADSYEVHRTDEKLDVNFFQNYAGVKKRLSCKLIHSEKNRGLLKEVPHVDILDLSLVFYCLLIQESFGQATVMIRNEFLELWDVDAEQLCRDALSNMNRILPPDIVGMGELLGKSMQEHIEEQLLSVLEENGPDTKEGEEWLHQAAEELAVNVVQKVRGSGTDEKMYILTNRARVCGAAYMAQTEVLAAFAEKMQSGFVILPSSIHELILIPEEEEQLAEDVSWFKNMVREVNETQVDAEDVLSDSVYYFDFRKKKVLLL